MINECEMDSETDDFESNLSFRKEGRVVGGKRFFLNIWSNFFEIKVEVIL